MIRLINLLHDTVQRCKIIWVVTPYDQQDILEKWLKNNFNTLDVDCLSDIKCRFDDHNVIPIFNSTYYAQLKSFQKELTDLADHKIWTTSKFLKEQICVKSHILVVADDVPTDLQFKKKCDILLIDQIQF